MLVGVFTEKIVLFHKGSTEYGGAKIAFFLPVYTLTVLHTGFLGRTTMCLDFIKKILLLFTVIYTVSKVHTFQTYGLPLVPRGSDN